MWQVWRNIWHFLGVDVRPIKVIVGILLIIALREPLVKCAAPCKNMRKTLQIRLKWDYGGLKNELASNWLAVQQLLELDRTTTQMHQNRIQNRIQK